MNEYKVSVIVGIYNSGRFLRRGLDSIMNQSWTNLEVILMNDGSTDDSGSICDEYSKMDERFIVINKRNSGVCDSRNKGLDIATGDYVCFMDGDDWFSPDFVAYLMEVIIKTNTKMALSDKLFTTLDQKQNEFDSIEVWDYEKTITNIIYLNMVLGPWNKMYSMELIRDNHIRFPSHWFGETLHFANTVAFYSKNIGVGHRKIYNYRLNNAESGTTKFNVEVRLLSIDNVTKLRECCFAVTRKIKDAIKWHLFDNYFILLFHIIATNQKGKYLSDYKEAKRYLRKNWISVFFRSKINISRKVLVAAEGLFPVICSKKVIKRLEKQHLRAFNA